MKHENSQNKSYDELLADRGPKPSDLLLNSLFGASSVIPTAGNIKGVQGYQPTWCDDSYDILNDRLSTYINACINWHEPITIMGLVRTVGIKTRRGLYELADNENHPRVANLIGSAIAYNTEQHEKGLHGASVTGHIFALKCSKEPWQDSQPVVNQTLNAILVNPFPDGSAEIVLGSEDIVNDVKVQDRRALPDASAEVVIPTEDDGETAWL